MAKRIGQCVCLLLLLLAGCVGKPELPADPLFPNGKPTESKVQVGPPSPPPFSEPMPPMNKTPHYPAAQAKAEPFTLACAAGE